MNSCKEFELDDLLAITAIPVSDYTLGAYAWQLTPTIRNSDFSASLARTEKGVPSSPLKKAITVGLRPAITGGTLIPIIRTSGKAKDDESDSVAGRKHTVAVSCEADDRASETWDYLLYLERNPCHLLLTFRGGSSGFVAATDDSYTCEVNREGAKTSVEFQIENWMGIQLITA